MNHHQSSNPFAYRRRQLFRGWPWWAATGAVIAMALFAAPRACDWFLLNQLTQGMDDLPSGARAERLQSIGQLGIPGIPVLVEALTHRDRSVARSSLHVLKSLQDEMMQNGQSEGAACHFEITRQLAARLPQIPRERYALLKELLNQTLLDTLDLDLQVAQRSYQTATSLLAQISREPEVFATAPALLARTPQALVPKGGSEPHSSSNPEPSALDSISEQTVPENAMDDSLWDDPSEPAAQAESQPLIAMQHQVTLHPLVETSSLQPAMLNSESAEAVDSRALPIGGAAPILSAGGYSTSGTLEAYSTRAVIDLLSSIRKPLAQSARSELIGRGFQPAEMALAVRLASNNATVRNSLIDEITNRSDIDPRRWLFWLAEDAERSVRLRALSALGTMNDPNVAKQLRSLLSREQDPTVAARIRQALKPPANLNR